MTRYERQSCLPEVGHTGQQRLQQARILVVGVGGLGCPASQYLVAGGIGAITLIDGDSVSESNLHRQILFGEADIGLPKVECAKSQLASLNSGCKIIAYQASLRPDNVDALCAQADVVLDCADNFATSYILSDFCYTHQIPLISASALGFTGYVGGYCGDKPSLRAMFPDLPQRAQNCATAGVMGAAVGALGCIQAQFAINTLLQLTPSPLGQLISLDLRNLKQGAFRFDDAKEPPPERTLRFIGSSAIETKDWVVDLRTEIEDSSSSLQVTRMHVDDFIKQKPQPDQNQRAVIVCKTGLRAWRAARALQEYWQGDIELIAQGDLPIALTSVASPTSLSSPKS